MTESDRAANDEQLRALQEELIGALQEEVASLRLALDELNSKKPTEAKESMTEIDPADNARDE